MSAPPTPLTPSDRVLLAAIQQDARRTVASLAAEAALSSSAAQRRLQYLRDAGVVEREVAVVSQRAVGIPLTLLVELELHDERPDLLPGLHAWIARAPEVQSAWQVTGRGDYLMVVLAASVEAFDAFMARLMEANRGVRKFTTSVALKTLKRTLSVPVRAGP
jgi:Lrp/AsnC family leucine-responsive transcriptional regulator